MKRVVTKSLQLSSDLLLYAEEWSFGPDVEDRDEREAGDIFGAKMLKGRIKFTEASDQVSVSCAGYSRGAEWTHMRGTLKEGSHISSVLELVAVIHPHPT